MTRAEFDALVDSAVTAILAAEPVPSHDDPAVTQRAREAMEEAQLLEAEARSFADAVDRHTVRIDYGAAVMLEGSNGVVVVQARTYADAPIYWQTVAGRLDSIVQGPELIEQLTAIAARAGSPAAS